MSFAFLDNWTKADIEAVIARNDPAELVYVPVAVSMDPPDDGPWAEGVCLALAEHADAQVRANSILGFGHLARVLRAIHDAPAVRAAVERALADPDKRIAGQADAAADDLSHFLGWTFAR